jgi:microcystin-dependent protein
MDPILGQIILWPGTFIPSGWMLCDGSKMQISTNAALYSLIGATYGGDGQTYFNLPDLRGVAPIGIDPRTPNALGKTVGAATADVNANGGGQFTLAAANLPGHTHEASFAPAPGPSVTVNCSVAIPALANPDTTQKSQATNTPGTGTVLTTPTLSTKGYSTANPDTTLKPFTASGTLSVPAGGGTVTVSPNTTNPPQAVTVNTTVKGKVPTYQPSMFLNYIIAIEGIYPTRP